MYGKTNQQMNTDNKTCTLSDSELIEKVYEWVRKLAGTGGKAWSLQIPVNFNNDPDMLIVEVCKRLKSRSVPEVTEEQVKKAVIEILQGDYIHTVKSNADITDCVREYFKRNHSSPVIEGEQKDYRSLPQKNWDSWHKDTTTPQKPAMQKMLDAANGELNEWTDAVNRSTRKPRAATDRDLQQKRLIKEAFMIGATTGSLNERREFLEGFIKGLLEDKNAQINSFTVRLKYALTGIRRILKTIQHPFSKGKR